MINDCMVAAHVYLGGIVRGLPWHVYWDWRCSWKRKCEVSMVIPLHCVLMGLSSHGVWLSSGGHCLCFTDRHAYRGTVSCMYDKK